MQKLLASNARPEAKEIAKILWQYPEEKAQIISLCQQSLGGNLFVQQVIKEYEGWHVDMKGQRLAWGDDKAESKDFFVAGVKEQGARWQVGDFKGSADKEGLAWQKGESWTGLIGKNGLHTEIVTGDEQKVVLEGNYKNKEATLKGDYLFGDSSLGFGAHGKDLDELGGDLHGKTKLGEGTLSGKVGLDKTGKDGDLTTSAALEYKDKDVSVSADGSYTSADKYQAEMKGKLGLNKDASVSASAGVKKEGKDLTVSGGAGYQAKGGELSASGSYTNAEKYQAEMKGKLAVGKDASVSAGLGYEQKGKDDTVKANLGYKDKGGSVNLKGSYTDADHHAVDLAADKKLDEKTSASIGLGHAKDGNKTTETLQLGLKDDKNQANLGLSYTDPDNLKAKLDYARQIDKDSEIKARLEAGVQQGKNFAQLGLSGTSKSDDLVLQASLEALKNQNGLDVKASGDATITLVGEKLYGHAFVKLDGILNDPKYQVGGGITWTPKDKLALTLAGVVDQSGGFDARLQLDLFQKKIKNARDLDENKKKAALSVFAGYRQEMDGGFLNDRFGAGKFATQSGQAYFGVGFRF